MSDVRTKIERRLAAILTVDTVGYSRMMEADEAGTLARLKAMWAQVFYPKIDEYDGRVIKTLGDGLLCEFHSAIDAIECAIDAQTMVAGGKDADSANAQLRFRIGIHLGDVIVEGEDLFGDGVNVSARLEALAAPGGICISGVTHGTLQGEMAAAFEFGGERKLKNISRPVPLWHWPLGTVEARASIAGKKSAIAIVPFASFSDDADLEGLADGLADALTTAFSRRTGFDVIAHGISARYKDHGSNFDEIRRQLGARYILTGTMRRSGNRVRITAELLETVNGKQLWSERYDRNLDDVFELQDDLTDRIALAVRPAMNALDGRLLADKPESELTDNERLTKSAQHFFQRTRMDFEAAEHLLETVLGHDPDNSMATSMLGFCIFFQAFFGVQPLPKERAERSWALAERGVVLNPASDYAYVTHGLMALHMWGNHELAILDAKRALEQSPQYNLALTLLGEAMSLSGNSEEGVPIIRKIMETTPKNLADFGPWRLALSCFAAEDYELALKAVDKALQFVREMPPLKWTKATILVGQGRVDEAKALIVDLMSDYPEFNLTCVNTIMFKRPEDGKRFLDGLRTAGVPD
jgi:adenylate cyclase